ncbi:MAG: transketolase [Oligoflexia bacterium]|nr:transketolase [Oligoflexia bacterium]
MKIRYDKSGVEQCIKSIRVLSADAVEAAKSGHPGMPLGCADLAFILWHYFLRFKPDDPQWVGRDIFVLSAGHGSMLLYSLLHLYGFGVSLEDIKNFRQLDSVTPGHPEYGITKGVETTTGPLGQGFATGVGFAIARKIMQERVPAFGKTKVYAIVSDGDLMEGISTEAASLAGHLGLDNLIYLYDKNMISIEGSTDLAFTEDIPAKFRAMGWHTMVVDGHDHSQVIGALNTANSHKGSPVLIIANTVIGKGAKCKQGSAESHGAPLGREELQCLRENLEWDCPPFEVPSGVYEFTGEKIKFMETEYKKWNEEFRACLDVKTVEDGVRKISSTGIPEELYDELRSLAKNNKEASRKTSGRCIQVLSKYLPNLLGGSADLAPSNNTAIKDSPFIAPGDFKGKNIHYGVREHSMGAVANGISLHGGFIPFVSTFLIFSDYMRPAIRLCSLMEKQVIYVFTHDSIFVGEDGPTHQPIEQINSLRLIPHLKVLRPCNEAETVESWIFAIENKNAPTAIILSRQDLEPVLELPQKDIINGVCKGAYIAAKEKTPELECVVVASGSEIVTAVKMRQKLGAENWMRIVSMPCMELFLEQDNAYRNSVLPPDVKKVSIEAGSTRLWSGIVGSDGLSIGIDTFGASGPAEQVAKKMGIDVDSVAARVKSYLSL